MKPAITLKRRLAYYIYSFGYWICGVALKIDGIDREEFNRYWAKVYSEIQEGE